MVSKQEIQGHVEVVKKELAAAKKKAPYSDEAKKDVATKRAEIKGLRTIKKAIAADGKRKRR